MNRPADSNRGDDVRAERRTLTPTDKLCVIFNPAAARQRAQRRLNEMRDRLGAQAEFWPTERAGHGEELALKAAQTGFHIVAAAGGDGTVHEVANGILRAKRNNVTFGVLALGSANDYAHSLSHLAAPLAGRDPRPASGAAKCGDSSLLVDVGLVRDEKGRERYFVNTLGLGFSGAVALESRRIRWLQGLMLYGLACLRALCFRYACPTVDVSFDDVKRSAPTLSLTVAIGRREGSFVVAPDACLDDGLFDYLQVGPLSRWEVLRFMPKLASGGKLPDNHPAIWQGRCREVKLHSEAALTVHLDGEFFSLPEDNVRELDIRILPGALRVEMLDQHLQSTDPSAIVK